MLDAALDWGGDLNISSGGDIQLAGSVELSQQRIFRRLLTNPTDYIWQPTYGAGLGQFVGQANVTRTATGVVYAQIYQEASVAQQPMPVVTTVTPNDDTVVLGITYTEVDSGSSQALTFSVSV